MEKISPPWTLGQLSAVLKAELVGDPDMVISRPVPAHFKDANGIAFAESNRYIEAALSSGVGALIVSPLAQGVTKPHLKSNEPRRAFGMLLHLSQKPIASAPGVHPTAVIDPTAKIHSTANIGPFCVIESDAEIGENAKILAHCYIGPRSVVGSHSVLMSKVTLVQDVIVGSNCLLHPGCVIGADGFGFLWDGTRRVKIPQVGGVIIGNDVEIGANTCIDRATCGETMIGDGSKFDNLVHVAHNVQIGKDCAIAALVGLAGSCTVGDRVMMGGQAAMRDHSMVVDDVILAGRSGVISNVTEPGEYFGFPATPIRESMRQMAGIRRLPELLDRVRTLEKKIQELKK